MYTWLLMIINKEAKVGQISICGYPASNQLQNQKIQAIFQNRKKALYSGHRTLSVAKYWVLKMYQVHKK